MAKFDKKRPQANRQDLLAAKPIRNPRAETETTDKDHLEVTIPFEKPKGLTWFFRKKSELRRKFELDQLGIKVWDLCDGEHTVRQLIETVARDENINTREAEVSMLAYLETLGQRGIIFMALNPETDTPASTN